MKRPVRQEKQLAVAVPRTISLPREMIARLDQEARESERSVSAVIRVALKKHWAETEEKNQ